MSDLLLTRARLASLRAFIKRRAERLRLDAAPMPDAYVGKAAFLNRSYGLDHAASLITQWAAAERRKEKRRVR